MDATELRALADALEPMARAPRFEDFDVPAFCAWVRACADAEPVAWVDVADSYEGPYIFHGKELLPAGRHDLYTHPAPAAPQAEPKRGPACLWSRADDDTDVWETGCGHAFTIIDGTPGDNYMEFCCYCGRPLEQEIGGSDE